jgi:hypothetical protein
MFVKFCEVFTWLSAKKREDEWYADDECTTSVGQSGRLDDDLAGAINDLTMRADVARTRDRSARKVPG